MNAKQSDVSLTCNGKNVNKSMKAYLESFEYADVAAGDSDTITMEFADSDHKFVSSWMPKAGDVYKPSIIRKNWDKIQKDRLKCGIFYMDDFSLSGNPTKCSISAIAVPQQDGFHVTPRSTTWKNTTLKSVAEKIANRNRMSCVYDGFQVDIKEMEQSEKDDCGFLSGICDTYGLSIKVYADKIIIFDDAVYKKKNPVTTIRRKDCSSPSWSYREKAVKYTKVVLSYTSPDSDKETKVEIGSGNQVYYSSTSCDNQQDAILKAKALLKKANKDTKVMTISIPGTKKIYATNVVKLSGFYHMSGKYYVERVIHNISDNGYVCKLTLSKIDNI